eukprot:TRINITY_DN9521_c0_g1_i1.p1 TRINITY_DN9521_c0_g1~~TRINITY_DN9521_c0_g1_i1.p1  ORF type:complete len:515 (+),score=52.71 TRINITY_DN9521_c0_g1_i1:143-1687(+)
MSLKEYNPIFQWGFSFRTPKFLVPLFSNNIFSFGHDATQAGNNFRSSEADHLNPIIHLKRTTLLKNPKSQSNSSLERTLKETPKPIPKPSKNLYDKNDDEILDLLVKKQIPSYKLETLLGDHERGVLIRRKLIELKLQEATEEQISLRTLPYENFDYTSVWGRSCENVVGFIQVPVGIAGPLRLNGQEIYIPLSTTEGCLVASTHRGCKAISMSGGVTALVVDDGMTRGPCLRMTSVTEALALKRWIENRQNFQTIKTRFESTSRFAKLDSIKIAIAGKNVYARFKAFTGDAMGMNMVTKAVEACLALLQDQFPEMEVLSVSGNYCTDKKSAAINWTDGRGKYVVSEAVIKADIVRTVLKTTTKNIVSVNVNKNLVGSAMAGSVGGFNAHASNIVTAIFLATGQDLAQNVESSNCITLMEPCGENDEDLYVSCSMPSLEVGTIGGGTHLTGQAACLDILQVRGPSKDVPGTNSQQLAKVVCAAVLAGELSLLAALSAGDLCKSHMRLNRSKPNQ